MEGTVDSYKVKVGDQGLLDRLDDRLDFGQESERDVVLLDVLCKLEKRKKKEM